MSHGIKSLANNLAQYGRDGDTMLAHINPEEAGILKALGGSGTINPVTGLPEYRSFWKSITQPFQRALAPIIDPISNAVSTIAKPIEQVTLQPIGKALAAVDDAVIQPVTAPISKVGTQLDDAVAKAVPGGWGTLAQVAASFIPGVGPLTLGAMGAINGSGVLRGDHTFNLQGAIAGGAMSYGMASLGEYAKMAGDPTAVTPTVTPGGELITPPVDVSTLTSADIGALNKLSAPLEAGSGVGLQVAPPPGVGQNIMSGNFSNAASQIGTNISDAASNVGNSILNAPAKIGESAVSAYDKLTTPATYSDAFSSAGTKFDTALEGAGNNISQTASGIKNLLGAGDMTFAEAAKLGARSGVNPITALGATIYGGTGLMAVEEQKEQLKEQLAAGKIAQEEYNNAVAEIDRTADFGRAAVAKNPFNMNPDRSTTVGETSYTRNNPMDTLYNRNAATDRLYAVGGIVNPPDDQTQMANQTPMQNLQQSNAMGGLSQNNLGLGGLQSLLKGFDLQATNNSENQSAQQIDQGTGSGDNTSPLGNVNNTPAGQIGQPTSFYQSLGGGSNGNGLSGSGGAGGNGGAFPLQGQYGIVKMAAGGMPPRFLSGGGDGMSDSIRASIDGKQEARLADGEFVIPADVVSHLGNGSSKAGAKQLYSMMDKVRRARTGNPKQGKQINPNRYMPA
jgi:hypothetical protein